MVVVAVLLQRHIFPWNLVWRLDRCTIHVLHIMQVPIATRSSNDIRNVAVIERTGEALIVMNMAGENGIWRAPAGLNGLIENSSHRRAATVIGIRRVNGMVHRDDQRFILWSAAQFRL